MREHVEDFMDDMTDDLELHSFRNRFIIELLKEEDRDTVYKTAQFFYNYDPDAEDDDYPEDVLDWEYE